MVYHLPSIVLEDRYERGAHERLQVARAPSCSTTVRVRVTWNRAHYTILMMRKPRNSIANYLGHALTQTLNRIP